MKRAKEFLPEKPINGKIGFYPAMTMEEWKSLPIIEAPWDTEFQKRYCSGCAAENCDACPNERFRNNPEWWLSLEADNGVAL